MKTWVVTGGAGSGKSLFCKILADLRPDARLFFSDQAVHQILGEPATRADFGKAFGRSILDDSGAVDRPKLRAMVFASKRARQRLEKLTHPKVYQRLKTAQQEAEAGGAQLFVAEIPLYYEVKSTVPTDQVILVAAREASQIRRLAETRGLDEAGASRILSAQLPLVQKLELAPVVVWNEGAQELLQAQAQLLLQQF
jgi:dephospho-CoA kinase